MLCCTPYVHTLYCLGLIFFINKGLFLSPPVLYNHILKCTQRLLYGKYLLCSFTSYKYHNITTLFMASEKGHHDVVQTLLGAGADVNITTSDVRPGGYYMYMN